MPGWSHFNLFNKDTHELFMLCILCLVPVIICYLFICARYSLLSFTYFIHCSTFYPHCCSILFFFNSFVFIIHFALLKRESSILILDCIPGISILLINNCTCCSCSSTPSSMQVNKHHTADCTNFVLV